MHNDLSAFGTVYSIFKKVTNVTIELVFSGLTDFISALMPSFLALYIIYIAFRLIVKQDLKTDTMSLIRIIIVIPLGVALMNYGLYQSLIVNNMMEVNENLSYKIVHFSNNTDAFKILDTLFFELLLIFNNGLTGTSWYNIPDKLVIVLLLIVATLLLLKLYFEIAKHIIIGVFWLKILFSIGIVPIFLLAYNETRGVFFSWAKALFTYFLYPIFGFIVIAFVRDAFLFMQALQAGNTSVTFVYLFTIIISLLIFIEVVQQIPVLANSLTGGGAMQSSAGSGVGRGISNAANAAKAIPSAALHPVAGAKNLASNVTGKYNAVKNFFAPKKS